MLNLTGQRGVNVIMEGFDMLSTVLFIVFLLTDFLMIGIFAFFFTGKEKLGDGMILWVHVPESAGEQEKVKMLTMSYKQSIKGFNIWNLISGIAICFLCFWNVELFLILWMVWLCIYLVLGYGLIYRMHRKMYDLKIELDLKPVLQDSEKDDDEYWKNGWYNNPDDSHFLVQDRISTTNYSMNMAKPAAKIIAILTAVSIPVSILFVFALVFSLEHAEVLFQVEGRQVNIDAAMYDTQFNLDEIQTVKILDKLPEDDYTRINGGATQKYLIGHFRGDDRKKYMMFLYRDYSPILEIKTTDLTIYVNSKEKGQVEEWSAQLME